MREEREKELSYQTQGDNKSSLGREDGLVKGGKEAGEARGKGREKKKKEKKYPQ